MLVTFISTLKKYLGISTNVREATKRPLEEESENEFEEVIFHDTEPQKKKRCSYMDHLLTSSNNAPGFSPVLNQISGLSGRKKENLNKVSDVKVRDRMWQLRCDWLAPRLSLVLLGLDPRFFNNLRATSCREMYSMNAWRDGDEAALRLLGTPSLEMSGHKSRQQKEGYGAEVIVTEERVKKWSDHFPCSTSKSVSCSAEIENDFGALKRKEARNVDDLATCCNHPTHSSLANFRFVASSSGSVQPDFSAKQKSRNSDCLSSSRNDKTRMKKSIFKGPTITLLDRSLGRKKSSSFLSSRIKHCLVHKSFLHEEKMKYRQLLQQYTEEHYLTPNSKVMSHKVSSLAALPVGMVSRSQWTPFMTKKKQEEIENKSTSSSSLRMLPSANNSVLEEVLGSKKIISLDENCGKYEIQGKSSSIHVPLVDLSKEDNEELNTTDGDSDGDSVIMIKELLSPQAQRNSLEERLKEHPTYDLEWVKTMQKEYEDRAYTAQKNADAASELIQELQQRRSKKVSLHEKVTQGLKLLDLTYPSKYTEVQLPDEEEEILVPLTPEMEDEINDALNKTPQSEVLIEKFHIQITQRDIKTLDGLNWLNDEVINFYMNLLMERSQKNVNYPRVYAFNTFFYPKLSKSGYHSVRRWTKKVDLFSYDMLLVPIHLGMHWCMSVVDFKTKCISYYDSMLHNNQWCLESLLEYLKAEHQDKKGLPYDTDVWKLQNKKDIPQQMNGSDCGMFACKFADYLSRRAKIMFDQQHMPYFRRRMVYEIISAKLL